MNKQQFDEIKNNLQAYKGKKVEFISYIPSADRNTKTVGYIEGVGKDVTEECVIIAERGLQHAIHYTKVSVI